MLDEPAILPEDPEELRALTARLLAEVKTQAILIEKLRHQLAGRTGSGLRPRRPSSFSWPWRPARSLLLR
jgi:hypothetical protein